MHAGDSGEWAENLPSDVLSNSGDIDFIFAQGNIHVTPIVT